MAAGSYAPKQAGGRSDIGHHAVAEAVRHARARAAAQPAVPIVLPLLDSPERAGAASTVS